MPAGRPTLYRPEYCETVIELGKKGKSIAQMAGEIGVSKQTLHDWKANIPEFSGALRDALTQSQKWWEDIGQDGLTMGKDFNAPLWSKNVSSRFRDDYGDKITQEVTGANGGPIEVSTDWSKLSTEEREAVRQALAKVAGTGA